MNILGLISQLIGIKTLRLTEVKSMVASLFWSAALVLLVHRNFLRERCSLVDQGVPEGMHHQPSSNLSHLV